LEGTYNDHLVQLPDQFRADQKNTNKLFKHRAELEVISEISLPEHDKNY